jgi:hypothetical protein
MSALLPKADMLGASCMSAKCHKRTYVFGEAVERRRSIEREGDDVVATFERKVSVTASAHCYVLLAIHGIGHRRCVDAGTGKERPQNLASRCVVRPEPAITLTSEQQPTGSR